MARKARVISDTGLYHIYLKGACNVFRSQEDVDSFLGLFEQIGDSVELLAYGLTKSCGNLFVKTDSISGCMKKLLTDYAVRFNRKYNHKGAVFLYRYKSEPVKAEYSAGLSRYIISGKKYSGVSDFVRSAFESDKAYKKFMNLPENETYGADCGTNSAEARHFISSRLNGKDFLSLALSERADIIKKLSDTGVNHSMAAKYLGVSRGTIINCINKEKAAAEKRRRDELVIL